MGLTLFPLDSPLPGRQLPPEIDAWQCVGTHAAFAEGALVHVLRFVNTFAALDVADLRELALHGLTIQRWMWRICASWRCTG